jgi:hypothetical protein
MDAIVTEHRLGRVGLPRAVDFGLRARSVKSAAPLGQSEGVPSSQPYTEPLPALRDCGEARVSLFRSHRLILPRRYTGLLNSSEFRPLDSRPLRSQ